MWWVEIGLRFLAWVITTTNASDKTKKKFLELVEATKDDGLITTKARDTFDKQLLAAVGKEPLDGVSESPPLPAGGHGRPRPLLEQAWFGWSDESSK